MSDRDFLARKPVVVSLTRECRPCSASESLPLESCGVQDRTSEMMRRAQPSDIRQIYELQRQKGCSSLYTTPLPSCLSGRGLGTEGVRSDGQPVFQPFIAEPRSDYLSIQITKELHPFFVSSHISARLRDFGDLVVSILAESDPASPGEYRPSRQFGRWRNERKKARIDRPSSIISSEHRLHRTRSCSAATACPTGCRTPWDPHPDRD